MTSFIHGLKWIKKDLTLLPFGDLRLLKLPFGWAGNTKIIHKKISFCDEMKSEAISTVTLAERFYFFYYLNASQNRSL